MSTDKTFDVTISLDPAAVARLICTALSHRNKIARSWSVVVGTYAVDINNCVGVLHDGNVDLADSFGGGTHRLDRAAVERGLAIMAVKFPRQFGRFLAGNGDDGTADAFLQCALLGEAKYAF